MDYSFTDSGGMEGCVGLVGCPIADSLPVGKPQTWLRSQCTWKEHEPKITKKPQAGKRVLRCPLQMWMLMTFAAVAAPVGTRLHWCTGSRPVRRDGQCCGRDAQCGRWTKRNWTKTVHSKRKHSAL